MGEETKRILVLESYGYNHIKGESWTVWVDFSPVATFADRGMAAWFADRVERKGGSVKWKATRASSERSSKA